MPSRSQKHKHVVYYKSQAFSIILKPFLTFYNEQFHLMKPILFYKLELQITCIFNNILKFYNQAVLIFTYQNLIQITDIFNNIGTIFYIL